MIKIIQFLRFTDIYVDLPRDQVDLKMQLPIDSERYPSFDYQISERRIRIEKVYLDQYTIYTTFKI